MLALGDMLRGGGGGSAEGDSSGLLSDWKAYEASGGAQADVEAGGGGSAPSQGGADGASTSAGALPFLSSTLSSAAGNVGATLGKMGSSAAAAVQDPSSAVQSAREALPDGSRLTYATALFGAGALLLFLAFVVALPVLIVFPAKFALSFTLGCACIVAGVAVLKGWREQMKHMISEDRRTFTAGYVGSMLATLWAALFAHSYLLCILFSGAQLVAMLYYVASYLPGGTAGVSLLVQAGKSAGMSAVRSASSAVLK